MSEEMVIGVVIGMLLGGGVTGVASKDRFTAILSAFMFGAGIVSFIYFSLPLINVIR